MKGIQKQEENAPHSGDGRVVGRRIKRLATPTEYALKTYFSDEPCTRARDRRDVELSPETAGAWKTSGKRLLCMGSGEEARSASEPHEHCPKEDGAP